MSRLMWVALPFCVVVDMMEELNLGIQDTIIYIDTCIPILFGGDIYPITSMQLASIIVFSSTMWPMLSRISKPCK